MAEFNPIAFNQANADRHLLDYLPPFLQQVQEFQAVNAASEPEIKAAWQSLGRVLGNQFVAEANGQGLTVWERELGVFAKDTDTLALRRARIKAAWQRQPPYTLRWLRGWLHELCGAGNYALNVEDYTLNIQLAYDRLPEPNALLSEILNILEPLKPANMLLRPAMSSNIVFAESLSQNLFFKSLRLPYRFINNSREIIRLNAERRLDGSWLLDQDIRSLIFQHLLVELAFREHERLSSAGALSLQNHIQTAEALSWPHLELVLRFGNLTFIRLNGERQLDGTGLVSFGIRSGWQLKNRAMAAGSLHLPGIKLTNRNKALEPRLQLNSWLANSNAVKQPELKLQSGWQEQNCIAVGTLTRDTMWLLAMGRLMKTARLYRLARRRRRC